MELTVTNRSQACPEHEHLGGAKQRLTCEPCMTLNERESKTKREFSRHAEWSTESVIHAKRIWFRVTTEEYAAIQQKQKEANIISRESFLRKIVMEGRILRLEIPELREISVLLSRCSTNLNQITRRVNSTGRLYAGELSETKQELARAENMMRKIYERLSEINI